MKFVEDKNLGYRMFIDDISVKFAQREEKIKELFDSGDREAILRRVEYIKAKVRAALIDPDMPRGIAKIENNGSVDCGSYLIENVLLTSALGSVIPVNVYKPAGACGRLPAIIMSTGHAKEGKSYGDTQDMSVNLALNGFVVAAYDPVCQGERRVWEDDVLAAYLGDMPQDLITVSMHTQPGNLAYMLEKNIASVFVNDSLTVVDYVSGRDDVDPEKLGATGRSGGGTQTLYLSACDDRIKVFSPIQCISKMRLMCVSGIGDCEQSLLNISAVDGFDYPDQAWASFPKPMFMNAALFDAFPIDGAREAEQELSRLYALAGNADDYIAKYAPCAHESHEESLQNMLDWFVERFYGTKAKKYSKIEELPEENLRCLKVGQQANRPWEIYQQQLLGLKAKRNSDIGLIRAQLIELIGRGELECDIQADEDEADAFSCGEGKYRSFCRLIKGSSRLTAVIAPPDYDISGLTADGDSVLVISPWAMEPAFEKTVAGYDTETKLFNASIISGKNILAQRVRHICAAIDYAAELVKASRVELVGIGAGAIPALLSAAVDEGIDKLCVAGLLPSYEMLFGMKAYRMPETNMMPGLLKIADIPELLKLPKEVAMFEVEGLKGFDYE